MKRDYNLGKVEAVLVKGQRLQVLHPMGRDRVMVTAPVEFVMPGHVHPVSYPSRAHRKVSITVAGVPLIRRRPVS